MVVVAGRVVGLWTVRIQLGARPEAPEAPSSSLRCSRSDGSRLRPVLDVSNRYPWGQDQRVWVVAGRVVGLWTVRIQLGARPEAPEAPSSWLGCSRSDGSRLRPVLDVSNRYPWGQDQRMYELAVRVVLADRVY